MGMAEDFGRTAARGTVFAVALLLLSLVLAAPALAVPPANDNFIAAEVLTGDTATTSGTTLEATKETAEPNHAWYAGGASIWYRWTAPSDGVATIDTFGSSFDTLLGVYTGLSVGGLHEIASNDQYNGSQSRVRFSATAGTEYRIAVDGWNAQQGAVTLNVGLAQSPPNDAFANAAVLSGSSTTATGTNAAASIEPGEPYLYGGSQSVWWTWTAPTTTGVT